jgi:hypothetical protein
MKKALVKCCGIPFTVHYKTRFPHVEIVKMLHQGEDLYEMIDPYKMVPVQELLRKKEFEKK